MNALEKENARKLFQSCDFSARLTGNSGVINTTTSGDIFATWGGVIVAILEMPSFRWRWYGKCPNDFAQDLRVYARSLKNKNVRLVK